MDDVAQLLQIEPSQLTFHCKETIHTTTFFSLIFNFHSLTHSFAVELKKQSSCLLHLVNKTTNYVAFKVRFHPYNFILQSPLIFTTQNQTKPHEWLICNLYIQIKTTAPKKYCVRPNQGIVAPQVTYDVTGINSWSKS